MDATKTTAALQLQELPTSGPSSMRDNFTSDQPCEESSESLRPESRSLAARESTAGAWLAVLGAFLLLFTSYGFMQTIGTVQSYLELHQLSEYSSRDVGWITGTFTALALFLGIQVGPLFDAYGPRYLGPVGCLIYIPSLFVLAECRQYWQFMLVLGIWGGIGAAVVSMVGVGVISKWFIRRRGMAMGLALCGSSIGGVVMPLMLRKLLSSLGWTWSMRILAFLLMGLMIAGSLCLLQPLPETPGAVPRRRVVVLNFQALRSGAFAFVTLGVAALEFAIFGVFSLLPTYATAAHFDTDASFMLVAVANGTSTVGRLFAGLTSDYFGHFNVLLGMIVFTTTCTAAILVPFGSSSLGALIAFSALWGFGSGSFISLAPVCIGLICDTEDYGRYFGTMYFFVSFSLLMAPPLGGQMLRACGTRALAGLYVAVVALGGICFFFARRCLYRKHGLRIWAKI